MKNFKIIIFIIIISMFFVGCGNLSSKNELIDYANKNYGECVFLEEDLLEDERILTLKDKEYNFEYSISSYMGEFILDSTYFGSTPDIMSTFTEGYLMFFYETYKNTLNKIENENNCVIEINEFYNPKNNGDVLIYLYVNTNNYKEISELLCKFIKEYDTRDYFNKGIIYIQKNNECIGEFILKEEIYKNKQECNTEWALSSAYNIMKYYLEIKIRDSSELKFLYSEVLDVKDVYGINDETLAYRLGDTNESLKNTTVWHYIYKNEEWIIADCLVEPYGHLYVYKLTDKD